MKFCQIFCVVLPFLLTACEKVTTSRTQTVLGTVCTIQLFDDGTESLYDALFSSLHQIEHIFSVNKPNTVISAINNAAGTMPVSVPDAAFFVLQKARYFSALTNGAFDPTIGPLVALWGINTEHAHVPTITEIEGAVSLINWRHLILDDQQKTAFLAQSHMALDLGGIAKGYAADALVTLLKKQHVSRAIIDLGGNLYLLGEKKDKSLWQVGIKDPMDVNGTPALLVKTAENSVVTSGVYERFLECDGVRYHHILDTHTGFPVQNGLLSVTVISRSSLEADALSTGLFALGRAEGLILAEKQGVAAIFIDEDKKVWTTKQIRKAVEILNEAYAFAE